MKISFTHGLVERDDKESIRVLCSNANSLEHLDKWALVGLIWDTITLMESDEMIAMLNKLTEHVLSIGDSFGINSIEEAGDGIIIRTFLRLNKLE